MVRIGIDVGGTFTDLVALDEETGRYRKIKVPSTPAQPELGVLAALEALFETREPGEVSLVSHSTTIATNALLGQMQLELPRVALLTTEGFRDVLEIGRQNRSEVYNLFVRRPRVLVAREDRLGIAERLDAGGNVVRPLDTASLEAALQYLETHAIGSVAVAFLHAYRNPVHERAVGDVLRERMPHVDVTLSSDADPEYREYERTSTTVVSALLRPIVGAYLDRLSSALSANGVRAPLYVMQSNGGMSAASVVARKPATTIESGPAAGAIGAAALARELGLERVLSFDMGGTTAKAGTIVGGEPTVAAEFEAAGRTHSGRAVAGSGYPVRFPFVDLAEISAGGGTLAWVDAGGALRVGPLSAGADPGPAAYGKSSQPTVTDANLVLGRLNPVALLGGAMPIDLQHARSAVASLGPSLAELDLDGIASGIVELVDNEMAKVLRIVTLERGLDPRTFTLVAFGGGGPLHACSLATQLGIPRAIVPADPGLFSAVGLLAADVRVPAVRTLLVRAAVCEPHAIEGAFRGLQEAAARELAEQRIAPENVRYLRQLDVRYAAQSFELSVEVAAPFDAAALGAAVEAFHAAHERTYGYASRGDAVEFVAARLTGIGSIPRPPHAAHSGADRAREDGRPVAHRLVRYAEPGRVETPVYERMSLRAGQVVEGPALIEQYDSCTLVAPGWTLCVDTRGNLDLRAGA